MAVTVPQVDPLSTPPTKTDPTNFAVRADIFLSELQVFSSQLASVITELNKLTSGLNNVEPAGAYNSGTTYNFPEIVACIDGFTYRCVGSSVVGVNPMTDDGTSWVKQVAPSILEAVEDIDLTGVGSAALDGINYDIFNVENFNQATTLTLTMNVGRTATIFLRNPGENALTIAITGVTTIYWEGGAEMVPDPVGVSLATVTRLTSTVAVISYNVGYNTVA